MPRRIVSAGNGTVRTFDRTGHHRKTGTHLVRRVSPWRSLRDFVPTGYVLAVVRGPGETTNAFASDDMRKGLVHRMVVFREQCSGDVLRDVLLETGFTEWMEIPT